MKLRDIILSGIWLIAIIGIVFDHLLPESGDAIFKITVGVELTFFTGTVFLMLRR